MGRGGRRRRVGIGGAYPLIVVLIAAPVLAQVGPGDKPATPSHGPPYDPRAAFAEADTNHDGVIDQEEFYERMVEVFYQADANKDGVLSPSECSETLVQKVNISAADLNHDGKLSLQEFMRARFKEYDRADTNDDGMLELDEVLHAYQTGGKP
jgi:Ca2+-binding EF-hand superfamily protein